MKKRNVYSAAALVIALALASLSVSCGGKEQPANAAPTPEVIKASSGNGTTVSYEARETSEQFTVKPVEAKPGEPVVLEWNVPDAEDNSVRIEGVDRLFPRVGRLEMAAPSAGTAWRVENTTSATADLHVYRLDARRKGGGETIKLEARLKVLQPEKR